LGNLRDAPLAAVASAKISARAACVAPGLRDLPGIRVSRGPEPHPESHEHDGERQGRRHDDGLKSAKAACHQQGRCDRSVLSEASCPTPFVRRSIEAHSLVAV